MEMSFSLLGHSLEGQRLNSLDLTQSHDLVT